MTNLSRTSTAALVDMLGELKAEKAELALREAQLKNMLVKRGADVSGFGFVNVSGDLFDLTVSRAMRSTLDTALLKTSFSDAFLEPFMKQNPVVRWDVRARKAVAA